MDWFIGIGSQALMVGGLAVIVVAGQIKVEKLRRPKRRSIPHLLRRDVSKTPFPHIDIA